MTPLPPKSTTSTLPAYGEAIDAAVAVCTPLAHERIALADAAGRVLAEPVIADRDLPPFHRAMMDGYALRAADLHGSRDGGTSTTQRTTFDVVGEIRAGDPPDVRVGPGQCIAIATGAALPDDVDTVLQHELSDRRTPVTFTLEDAGASITRGHAVHPRGADAKAGSVLIAPPRRLSAHHLAIAASVGAAELTVARQPRAILLTSGNEVRPVGEDVAPHQIRNSNAPMLVQCLRTIGVQTLRHEHLADEPETTNGAVARAIADADLVVTVGGVSAGDHDYFPDAFDAHSVQPIVTGARIQPGKPIRLGRAPNGAMVVALPGNPVSALACAHLFIWPVVNVMLGLPGDLPWRTVTLGESVRGNAKRRAFRPAAVDHAGRAVVPAWAGSGDIAHTATTDGLLELPMQADPVPAGASLRFLPWADS